MVAAPGGRLRALRPARVDVADDEAARAAARRRSRARPRRGGRARGTRTRRRRSPATRSSRWRPRASGKETALAQLAAERGLGAERGRRVRRPPHRRGDGRLGGPRRCGRERAPGGASPSPTRCAPRTTRTASRRARADRRRSLGHRREPVDPNPRARRGPARSGKTANAGFGPWPSSLVEPSPRADTGRGAASTRSVTSPETMTHFTPSRRSRARSRSGSDGRPGPGSSSRTTRRPVSGKRRGIGGDPVAAGHVGRDPRVGPQAGVGARQLARVGDAPREREQRAPRARTGPPAERCPRGRRAPGRAGGRSGRSGPAAASASASRRARTRAGRGRSGCGGRGRRRAPTAATRSNGPTASQSRSR